MSNCSAIYPIKKGMAPIERKLLTPRFHNHDFYFPAVDARHTMRVNDLCWSLGIPGQFEHGRVRDAYAKAIQTCRKYGKHVGVGGLSTYPSLTAEFVKMGARYVSKGRH